jgi:hypothetical protein
VEGGRQKRTEKTDKRAREQLEGRRRKRQRSSESERPHTRRPSPSSSKGKRSVAAECTGRIVDEGGPGGGKQQSGFEKEAEVQ